MIRRLLDGALGPMIITLLVCMFGLLVIELIPNVSIKAMLRLFFITTLIIDLLTAIWATLYWRKKYPEYWVELIYPKQ